MEDDSSESRSTFVPVLSPPPPNRNDLESHALDKEGRDRYLKSLGELNLEWLCLDSCCCEVVQIII